MKKFLAILLSYTFVFTVSEILYRLVFNIPSLARIFETTVIFFLISALYYFSKYKITRFFIILLFFSSTVINNVHYEIYKNWINSTNYLLMFTEATEVANAGITMIDKLLPSIIWGVVETLIFLSISKFRKKTTAYADIIFILILFFISIRAFIKDDDPGILPREHYPRVKANTFAVGSFIGRVLPYEFLDLKKLENYSHPKPNKISTPKFRNIIFIVGESLSVKHLHTFGYPRNTTPFLDYFSQQYPDALLKKSYAAGVYTGLSLPSLFNAVPYPNGLKHIIKGDTNLFQLAKEQGFKTIYHSSQPEREMDILNLMGKRWIDEVTFPTQLGYSVKEGMNDHKLLPYLYNTDFSQGSHFFILHQRGSHMPYGKYLTDENKQFKGGTALDNYDSTIFDTDTYIKKVFDFLSTQKTDDWLLIYTSDHGQNVTKNVYNQGTHIEDSYLVPIMAYTPNKALQKEITNQFSQCNIMFHQQLATLLISIMGYDMPISDCSKGIIHTNFLNGNSGYLKVEKNNIKFAYPNR